MKIRGLAILTVALFICMFAQTNGADETEGLSESVLFSHGDILHGTFVQADADNVQWKRPGLNKHAVLSISRKSLVGVNLLKPTISMES